MYHSVVLAVCLCWKRCNIAKKEEVRCRHRLRLFHIIISLCLTTRKHNQTTSTWNALFFVILFSCDFVQIASRCVCLIDVNKVLGAAHCSRNDTLASFVGQYNEKESKNMKLKMILISIWKWTDRRMERLILIIPLLEIEAALHSRRPSPISACLTHVLVSLNKQMLWNHYREHWTIRHRTGILCFFFF